MYICTHTHTHTHTHITAGKPTGNYEKLLPRVLSLKKSLERTFHFFFADLGPDDEDDERKEKNYQLQHCLHRPDAYGLGFRVEV